MISGKQFQKFIAAVAILLAAQVSEAAVRASSSTTVRQTAKKPTRGGGAATKPVAKSKPRLARRCIKGRAKRLPVRKIAIVRYVQPDLSAFPEMVPPLPDLSASELQDSFFAARVGRRVHHAIDIMRPEGTPMVACVDGFIERLESSALGGTSIYLVDTTRRHRFYYAHLSAYAEGLSEGLPVLRGTLIGYVGSTGNASATAPHLHFQVVRDGGLVNPYPLLRQVVGDSFEPPPPLPQEPVTTTAPSATVVSSEDEGANRNQK